MAFKIYTKTGDKGETSLIGGTRVPKYDIRIEAYGTVDELNSYLGLIRDYPIDEHSRKVIIEIQDRLFTIGSLLAEDSKKSKMKLPQLKEEDIVFLENEIDQMDATLEPMKSFILPGGHPVVSHGHIARCICRRAERITLLANQQHPINSLIIKYLNRLSDYLFTLSRFFSKQFNAQEIPWNPRF